MSGCPSIPFECEFQIQLKSFLLIDGEVPTFRKLLLYFGSPTNHKIYLPRYNPEVPTRNNFKFGSYLVGTTHPRISNPYMFPK